MNNYLIHKYETLAKMANQFRAISYTKCTMYPELFEKSHPDFKVLKVYGVWYDSELDDLTMFSRVKRVNEDGETHIKVPITELSIDGQNYQREVNSTYLMLYREINSIRTAIIDEFVGKELMYNGEVATVIEVGFADDVAFRCSDVDIDGYISHWQFT